VIKVSVFLLSLGLLSSMPVDTAIAQPANNYPDDSAAKDTSSSGFLAMARRHPVTARLNGSVGLSLPGVLPLMLDDMGYATWAMR
jgi:hypothetical protein